MNTSAKNTVYAVHIQYVQESVYGWSVSWIKEWFYCGNNDVSTIVKEHKKYHKGMQKFFLKN